MLAMPWSWGLLVFRSPPRISHLHSFSDTLREPRGRRSPPVARALTPLAGPTTSSQHVPGDRAAPPRTIARRSPSDGRTRIGPVCLYGYDAHRNIGFLTDGTGA